jgi:hypothetical protein
MLTIALSYVVAALGLASMVMALNDRARPYACFPGLAMAPLSIWLNIRCGFYGFVLIAAISGFVWIQEFGKRWLVGFSLSRQASRFFGMIRSRSTNGRQPGGPEMNNVTRLKIEESLRRVFKMNGIDVDVAFLHTNMLFISGSKAAVESGMKIMSRVPSARFDYVDHESALGSLAVYRL